MDLTIESFARIAVVAAAATQALAGLAVLVRQILATRPEPTARVDGPLGYVNFAGLAGFVVVAPAVALTGAGSVTAGGGAADVTRVLGLIALSAAGLLAAAGIRAMGSHLVAPAEIRPDTELITGGPFALVRHPLYDSILLLWIGGTLALLSPAMGVVVAVLVPALWLRAAAEERMLARHFGAAWAEYAARVPMLLPRMRPRGR